MGLLKSIGTLVATPLICAGELVDDLQSLTDIRKDEADGILSICTLGASSVIKGTTKAVKKACDELGD